MRVETQEVAVRIAARTPPADKRVRLEVRQKQKARERARGTQD